MTVPGHAAYGAVKGTVEVLTRYQAKELGGRGTRINTIAPGATVTDFGGGMMHNEQVRAYLTSQVALGRVDEPDDIGAALAALLSDANRWVTASVSRSPAELRGAGGSPSVRASHPISLAPPMIARTGSSRCSRPARRPSRPAHRRHGGHPCRARRRSRPTRSDRPRPGPWDSHGAISAGR
ncbi:SDR family oxidoreductase [Streptomyces sp. NPDC002928]|uniref:SDR family oxidoreductase n=1 Tax=Streptomyces sp. NPDC002928 TaxID=3154440 RepID=UPI0033A623C8